MRSQITSVACAIALLGFGVEGRKQLIGADEERLPTRTSSPIVRADVCEDQCIWGKDTEDKIYWCFAFEEPMMTLGWEYNQDANTDSTSTPLKHLRFDLLFYLENEFQVTSTMDIYRLYYNQSMLEIPQIDLKLDLGTIFNENGQYCPHLSWNRGSVGLNSTYRQEFMNCSKTLVNNPWDYYGVYKGKYAQYFDECSRSQAGSSSSDDPQVTATFWEIEWFESKSEIVLSGSVDPISETACWNMPLFSAPASYTNAQGRMVQEAPGIYHQLYKNAFNYFYERQSEKVNYKGSYSTVQ